MIMSRVEEKEFLKKEKNRSRKIKSHRKKGEEVDEEGDGTP